MSPVGREDGIGAFVAFLGRQRKHVVSGVSGARFVFRPGRIHVVLAARHVGEYPTRLAVRVGRESIVALEGKFVVDLAQVAKPNTTGFRFRFAIARPPVYGRHIAVVHHPLARQRRDVSNTVAPQVQIFKVLQRGYVIQRDLVNLLVRQADDFKIGETVEGADGVDAELYVRRHPSRLVRVDSSSPTQEAMFRRVQIAIAIAVARGVVGRFVRAFVESPVADQALFVTTKRLVHRGDNLVLRADRVPEADFVDQTVEVVARCQCSAADGEIVALWILITDRP